MQARCGAGPSTCVRPRGGGASGRGATSGPRHRGSCCPPLLLLHATSSSSSHPPRPPSASAAPCSCCHKPALCAAVQAAWLARHAGARCSRGTVWFGNAPPPCPQHCAGPLGCHEMRVLRPGSARVAGPRPRSCPALPHLRGRPPRAHPPPPALIPRPLLPTHSPLTLPACRTPDTHGGPRTPRPITRAPPVGQPRARDCHSPAPRAPPGRVQPTYNSTPASSGLTPPPPPEYTDGGGHSAAPLAALQCDSMQAARQAHGVAYAAFVLAVAVLHATHATAQVRGRWQQSPASARSPPPTAVGAATVGCTAWAEGAGRGGRGRLCIGPIRQVAAADGRLTPRRLPAYLHRPSPSTPASCLRTSFGRPTPRPSRGMPSGTSG